MYSVTTWCFGNVNVFWHVKSLENLTWKSSDCPPCLSDVATVPWEIKSHFQQYYSYIILIVTLSHQKTICNPLAHPTWKNHNTNLWIAKIFHLTKGLLHSFKHWRLWKKPVVGCRRWLWQEPVVMRGNWNVRQAVSVVSKDLTFKAKDLTSEQVEGPL